ncbi:MAG: prefoldin subunit beta [Candidatus Altiarchaeota archaeon]
MDIPKEVQDKLAQFQNLQNQLQMIAVHKQQMFISNADADNAVKQLAELKKGTVYRMAGPLLIETDKKTAQKNLAEEKEVFETRSKMLEKQEKTLSEKLQKLGTELQTMMGKPGGPGPGQAG